MNNVYILNIISHLSLKSSKLERLGTFVNKSRQLDPKCRKKWESPMRKKELTLQKYNFNYFKTTSPPLRYFHPFLSKAPRLRNSPPFFPLSQRKEFTTLYKTSIFWHFLQSYFQISNKQFRLHINFGRWYV